MNQATIFRLDKYRITVEENNRGQKPRYEASNDPRFIFKHLEVFYECYGYLPQVGHEVHHISGNRYDNESSNLIDLPKTIHEFAHRGKVLLDRASLEELKGVYTKLEAFSIEYKTCFFEDFLHFYWPSDFETIEHFINLAFHFEKYSPGYLSKHYPMEQK